MSVQQCLACNAMVPRSSRTCDCGHVFEDVKQIAGKRFSEYRAELYWRLESKRMKILSKENQPVNGISTDENNNESKDSREMSVNETDKEPGASSVVVVKDACRKRFFQRKVKGLYSNSRALHAYPAVTSPYQRPTCIKDRPVSPELLRRLSQALEEINKKIHTQNLMWKTLV